MQYLKDMGFVIRRINFGESDRYITLFTQKNGKVEVVARGVRKITSKRSSSVELLNLVSFSAVKTSKKYSEKSSAYILTEVEPRESFSHLKNDLSQVQYVFLICELLDALCPFGQPHEDIFKLVYETLKNSATRQEEQGFHWLQVQMLGNLGFLDTRKTYETGSMDKHIEKIIERKLKTKRYFKPS